MLETRLDVGAAEDSLKNFQASELRMVFEHVDL
jgi:hypothetical protein